MPDENRETTHVAARAPSLTSTVRYVLTHGWVWLCLVAVLGCYVAVMLSRGAPWRGDLIWTIDWLPIAFILAGPLIAGFVAVDTGRLAVGVRNLPLPRGRTFDLAVAMTYALSLVAIHVLFSVGTLIVSRPAVIDWGAPIAVLVQLAMVVLFVALGSLVGRFAPVVLGGLAAALAALAAVYLFSAPRSPVSLLYAGAATTPRIGYDYNVTWLLVQLAALAAVVLATWWIRAGRSRTRVVVTTLVATSVALGTGAAVAAVPGERLEANGARPDACGALADIPWCFYPQHERVMGFYADNLMMLFQAAQTHGYDDLVPERVLEADQRTWPSDATTAAFYVSPEALAGQRPELWETALQLVEPVHCPQLAGDLPPAEQYWKDLEALTATWVGLVDPELPDHNGYFGEHLAPDQAQQLWSEFRTCTYSFE